MNFVLGISGLAPLPHIQKLFFINFQDAVCTYKFIFELTIFCWVDKMSHVHVVLFCNLIGTARQGAGSRQFSCGCYQPLSSPRFLRREPGDEASCTPLSEYPKIPRYPDHLHELQGVSCVVVFATGIKLLDLQKVCLIVSFWSSWLLTFQWHNVKLEPDILDLLVSQVRSHLDLLTSFEKGPSIAWYNFDPGCKCFITGRTCCINDYPSFAMWS